MNLPALEPVKTQNGVEYQTLVGKTALIGFVDGERFAPGALYAAARTDKGWAVIDRSGTIVVGFSKSQPYVSGATVLWLADNPAPEPVVFHMDEEVRKESYMIASGSTLYITLP